MESPPVSAQTNSELCSEAPSERNRSIGLSSTIGFGVIARMELWYGHDDRLESLIASKAPRDWPELWHGSVSIVNPDSSEQ